MTLEQDLAIWKDKDASDAECDTIVARLRQTQGVNAKLAAVSHALADKIDADRAKYKAEAIAKIESAITEKVAMAELEVLDGR